MTRKQVERKFLQKGLSFCKFAADDKRREGPSDRMYRWFVNHPRAIRLKFASLEEAREWIEYRWADLRASFQWTDYLNQCLEDEPDEPDEAKHEVGDTSEARRNFALLFIDENGEDR